MLWLDSLLDLISPVRTGLSCALRGLRALPARFEHRTRQALVEYVGLLVVLGAVGLAAFGVGLA